VYREVIYREVGAFIDQERLWANLLSSQPLCFNLFGPLKLNLPKATAFFRLLLPDDVAMVEAIWFEHSPGRGDPVFTEDQTAFDVAVVCRTPTGEQGMVAIEVKYSEDMTEPAATLLRARYDGLSASAGLYVDPTAPALRAMPVQQLWREHLLASSMVESGLYQRVRYVVIHPRLNINCAAAIKAYRRHLIDPETNGQVRFRVVTLENCISALTDTTGVRHGSCLLMLLPIGTRIG
jgi:hypothetical protein